MSAWRTAALQEVATIERRPVDAASIRDGTKYVGLENIESGGRFVNVREVDAGELASGKFIFAPTHILYGKLRPYLAKVARPTFSGVCSTDILPILPGPELDRDYLAHFLLRPETVAWANSRATGANLPRLSPRALADVVVPVPPLAEQRKIAGVLNCVDGLRTKRRAAPKIVDDLKQAIFNEMFGAATHGTGPWPRRALRELCENPNDVRCGPFGTQLSKSEFRTEGVPLWGIKQVNASFSRPTVEFLEVTAADRLAQYSIVSGDIVMTRKGTVGNCAIYPAGWPPGIMHSDLLRLRVSRTLCVPEFLCHQLQHSPDVQRQLALISSGAVMPGINVSRLRALEVFVPPMSLQSQFKLRLDAMHSITQRLSDSATLLDVLMASLQDSAFRGAL